MIKKITIKNFKSIKECDIELRRLNVLCGTNASGKSSLIQSILFLAQNSSTQINHVMLNGEMVNLGEYQEVKNFETEMATAIDVSVINSENKQLSIAFNNDGMLRSIQDYNLQNQVNLFYLSANRIGNSDVYDKSKRPNIFGNNGEFAASFLLDHQDNVLSDRIIFDQTENVSGIFIDEVNYWMKKITGSGVNVQGVDRTNKLVVSYLCNLNKLVRNSNTGSGLSFVFSIIVLCLGVGLLSQDRDEQFTVIIENPEIHLHPKAQAQISDFLVWCSKFMQIIIETHSDHIFNGCRRAVKSKNINNRNMGIFFFSLNNNVTNIKRIDISESGKIATYEKDLFTQFELDLMELIRKDGLHN